MAILLMTRKTVTAQATYEIQHMMELWKDKIICDAGQPGLPT